MNEAVNRLLAALSLVLLPVVGGAWAVSAQTETPTPSESPFQTVRVDGFAYGVDPYFPCVAFITERVTRLDGEQGVVSTITMQLFVRAGAEMTALEPFITVESELPASAEVGQAFTCAPQEAVDREELRDD